jgi:3,4-dihydroxy 2-butanone 4-phosphate synthase/GTP cyclohydrolase II
MDIKEEIMKIPGAVISAGGSTNPLAKSIFGTTIFIGKMNLNTFYGEFMAHVYQDLIHKGYIIALAHGDLKADLLYTRLHSSCVTSETMRSMDCDCVKQLEGAIEVISKKNGIMFYILEEGRGVGYVGKSRACMCVQYTDDKLNTFDAYNQLGMKPDYRTYRNVKDICHLLGVTNTDFMLLTNNPDKIKGFKENGLKIKGVESIEIKPNPFNLPYLHSKMNYGHMLVETKQKIPTYSLPHEKIKPFEPYSLSHAERFVHVSSYYLPIKPVYDQIVMTCEEWSEILKEIVPEDSAKYIAYPADNGKVLIKILNCEMYDKYKSLTVKPYWFNVNVYYDIATFNDYIVLQYGNCNDQTKTPIVRIHSESIFNRFPLVDRKYRHRYKIALETIIKNGCGMIVLLYNDGRGSGLGHYVLDATASNKKDVGIKADTRDYDGALLLVKNHTKHSTLDVLSGDTSQYILREKFEKHKFTIRRMIPISAYGNDKGHASIYKRIEDSISYLERCKTSVIPANLPLCKLNVTGIGSSEAHARFFCYLMSKYFSDVKFTPLANITTCDPTIPCVVFSQGLSPNTNICFNHYAYSGLIVVTSVTDKHPSADRVQTLGKLLESKSNIIINYPAEYPDDTLVRINGPIGVYYMASRLASHYISKITNKPFDDNLFFQQIKIAKTNIEQMMYGKKFSEHISTICKNQSVCIIVPANIKDYMLNIKNKFIEGCYINPLITDDLEFAHGIYQSIEAQRGLYGKKTTLFIVGNASMENIYTMCKDKYLIWPLTFSSADTSVQPIELEMFFNHVVFQIISELSLDQKNWFGKDTQHIVYEKQM